MTGQSRRNPSLHELRQRLAALDDQIERSRATIARIEAELHRLSASR